MPDEFYGDEILLTSHETSFLSLFAMSAQLMIFDVMKFFIKLHSPCSAGKEGAASVCCWRQQPLGLLDARCC